MQRRAFLASLFPPGFALASDQVPCEAVRVPEGWCAERFQGRRVFRRGSGPPLILLHEINGLSPGCIDFGVQLAEAGFTVLMPLLFGYPAQDNIVFGYFESCWGSFSCQTPRKDMKIAGWLKEFVANVGTGQVVGQLTGKGIGVIGMCLTGALPLNVMADPRVAAVVMSQPALPFGKANQKDAGVSEATLKSASESHTPILAFRFKQDTISTAERFELLQNYFGSQFDGRQLDAPHSFHPDWTHRLHAVLTGPFGEQKQMARKAVIDFIHRRLDQRADIT